MGLRSAERASNTPHRDSTPSSPYAQREIDWSLFGTSQNPEHAHQTRKASIIVEKKMSLFAPINALNEQTSPSGATSDQYMRVHGINRIVEFIDEIQDEQDLIEFYNLLMLVDESTKSRYKNHGIITLFHKKLWRLIKRINSKTHDKNAMIIAQQLINIGKHSNEFIDEIVVNLCGKKFNTSTVNYLKYFIKKEKFQNITLQKNLNTGKKTRHQFFFTMQKYATEFNEEINYIKHEIKALNLQNEQEITAIENNESGFSKIFSALSNLKIYQSIINKLHYIRCSVLYKTVIDLCKDSQFAQNFEEEINILENIIKHNPHSKKHAAEHKNIELLTYKFTLYNLVLEKEKQRKTDDNELLDNLKRMDLEDFHIINLKELEEMIINKYPVFENTFIRINYEIEKQEKTIGQEGSYILAEENDFILPEQIKSSVKSHFKLSSSKFHSLFNKMKGKSTSYLLKRGEGEQKVLNNNFYASIELKDKTPKKFVKLLRSSNNNFLNINSAIARDQGLNHNPITNPLFTQIKFEGQTLSSLFHCGAIYSENSAKQYIVRMLLENLNQEISNEKLFIIDSRQVKNGLYKTLEYDVLNNHRILIKAEVKKLNNYIQSGRLDGFNNWLNQSGTALIESNRFRLESFFYRKRKIKFLCFNFSAYSSETGYGHGFAGRLSTKVVKNIKYFYNYIVNNKEFLKAKLTLEDSNLFYMRLNNLTEMLVNKKHYLGGHYSLATAMTVADILNLFDGTMSIACRSNKDRGSNAIIFNFITKSIFMYRKQKSLANANISYLDFQLDIDDDYEKQIVWQILLQNIPYLTTLYNTSWAGNKSFETWLKPIIRQASPGSKKLRLFYKELNSFSKNSDI